MSVLNFNNTEVAFNAKSNTELKKTAWLFQMMNYNWLVKLGAPIALKAVEWHLPFAKTIIKYTIFEQFCGGENLEAAMPTIDKLYKSNTLTALDYGAEAKESEADFDHTQNEFIKAINFAAAAESISVVCVKITGMCRFGLLESLHEGKTLTGAEQAEYQIVTTRFETVCKAAYDNKVSIFVDAEETWIQRPIDILVEKMMTKYNRESITIYNTYQMYLSNRLQYLHDSFARAEAGGYILGAKLVRGAYMDKERKRAEAMGYESPINVTKQATDDMYNAAVRFCVARYKNIASCCASHNADSNMLQANLISELGIQKNHPHLMFSQLYGMSDNLTFNLAHEGYTSSKYMVYGTVEDVIPYLIRRAQENTAVSGDMSREYKLIDTELKRRKLQS